MRIFRWLFSTPQVKMDKEYSDEVRAFKYNNKLYPSLHAMNAQKEKDRKREATAHIKGLLYYLCVDKFSYDMMDEWDKDHVQFEAERKYVFRGQDHDFNRLAELLIEHWPYVVVGMNEYHEARKKREASGCISKL